MGRWRVLMTGEGAGEPTAPFGTGGEELLKGHKCLMAEREKVN